MLHRGLLLSQFGILDQQQVDSIREIDHKESEPALASTFARRIADVIAIMEPIKEKAACASELYLQMRHFRFIYSVNKSNCSDITSLMKRIIIQSKQF